MQKITVKVEDELHQQLVKYSIANNTNKSEAVRRFIKQGIDNKIPENKLKQELRNIKQELAEDMKKHTERLVRLQVRNLMYTLINFHILKSDMFIKAMKHDFSDLKTPDDVNNFVEVLINKAKKSAVDDKVDSLNSKNKTTN